MDESVMKKRKSCIIPIPRQIAELVMALKLVAEPVLQFVFTEINDKRKSISENAILLVISHIGY